MPDLIYDLAIAAVLILSIWRGYRKGFILTLCGFLALFVALIGASAVSNALAEPVSQAIRPAVERHIQQTVSDHYTLPGLDDSQSTDSPDSSSENPTLSGVLDALKQSDLLQGFADTLENAFTQGLLTATSNAVRVVSDYLALQLAQIALFLISFLLILLLWFLVCHALDLAFRLPVLSTLNRWSGAGLGLLRGGLLIYIACLLLKSSILPQSAIQNSYLLHFFCTTDPLTLLSSCFRFKYS
jgi:uncharacterized membrane protein required for colicin V production